MATGVDARLLKSTKFPPEFNQKVDMQKVNLQVMKKWIAGRISEILGTEDDVVTELCFNLIESSRYPDIKALQIQLTGFLDKDTAVFCKELWKLFLSAQTNSQGVPKELLEAKKQELIQEKIEAERIAEENRRRREDMENRDREIMGMRDRERGDRFRGRGDWRGGRRGDRDFDSRRGGFGRPGYRSRSPPPARHRDYADTRGPFGGGDSYVPRGRRDDTGYGGHRRPRSRSRSSAYSSQSGSRSPSAQPSRRSPHLAASSKDRVPRRDRSGSRARDNARKRSRSPSRRRGDRYKSPRRSVNRPSGSRSRSDSRSPLGSRSRSRSRSADSRSPPPKRRRNSSASSDRSRDESRSRGRRYSPSPNSTHRRTRNRRDRSPSYSSDGSHRSHSSISRSGYSRSPSRRRWRPTSRSRSRSRPQSPSHRSARSRSKSADNSGCSSDASINKSSTKA